MVKVVDPVYPSTPDGRYFVVRGRLWRRTNPNLGVPEKQRLIAALMTARRDVRYAKNRSELKSAREKVNAAKRALGERGPVWWTDGQPDYNRRLVLNTPYADWFAKLNLE